MKKMTKFKEWLQIKGYSNRTVETIIRAVEYFKTWMEKENISDIAEVSHNDVIAYVQHFNLKGTAKKTIAHYIMHLSKYYNFLQEEGKLNDNPCSHIKIKGIKRKVLYEILSREELEQLYNNYVTEIIIEKSVTMKNPPPQHIPKLARKRNKVILGLLVFQAIRSEEIAGLKVQHIKLHEGKIFIPGSNRSNERTLKLESQQVFDLLDYINDTRKQILLHRKLTTTVQEVFLNMEGGGHFSNVLGTLLKHLKQINGKVQSLDQIRASVIVHWLKLYNLRKVQVMAGHRYISSTEKYQSNNLDDLKEDIGKYHPF
jgi:site-specific recombinase XerD